MKNWLTVIMIAVTVVCVAWTLVDIVVRRPNVPLFVRLVAGGAIGWFIGDLILVAWRKLL